MDREQILKALAPANLDGVTWDDVRRYYQSQEPAPKPVEAPGLPDTLTAKQREEATDLYEDAIMRKGADQVTPAERDHLNARILQVLRELGR